MRLDRRALLIGMTVTLVPRRAEAQPARSVRAPRIGWISTEAQPDPFVDGFREGLRRLGYVEGEQVILDLRYTRDLQALRAAVAELRQGRAGQDRAVRGRRAPAVDVRLERVRDAGGLMSYGANQRDTYVRLAGFADKMLRGARPADLPIEQPPSSSWS